MHRRPDAGTPRPADWPGGDGGPTLRGMSTLTRSFRRGGRPAAICLLGGSLLLAVGGCAGNERASDSAAAARAEVEQLADWLEGSFSSQAQAQSDPSYFDIRLRMGRIWAERTDGPWLYVEQARADMPDRPYRQRVYRLSRRSDGRLLSAIYTLPEPVSRFAGALDQDGAAIFATVSPEQLTLLDGCTVVLTWDAAARRYIGGTEGQGCASTREGARYTTSQIELAEGVLVSWDRGFDDAGQQVWGATAGGYRFERIQPGR